MKTAYCLLAALVVVSLANSLLAQDEFQPDSAVKEHEWLKQFAGSWDTKAEASFGPDQPPVECTGTMTSRMLGDIWVVSEVEGHVAGSTVKGLQTIGYDPEKKKYVGTWVDSMMNHLWRYEGSVDDTGKKLTLNAEGPNPMLPGKMTMYRDAYEFTSANEIIATSSMQTEDGTWVTFMTGKYTRKK